MDEVNALFFEISSLKENYAKTVKSIEETQTAISEKITGLEMTRKRIEAEQFIIDDFIKYLYSEVMPNRKQGNGRDYSQVQAVNCTNIAKSIRSLPKRSQ
jgi:hypothetical protein